MARTVREHESDLLVIDTAANIGRTLTMTMAIADLLLLPRTPSSLDLIAAQQTLDRIRTLQRRRRRPGPSIALIPTKTDGRSSESLEIINELRALNEMVGPMLGQHLAYVRAFTAGESVATCAAGSPADREMQDLAAFVLKQLGHE